MYIFIRAPFHLTKKNLVINQVLQKSNANEHERLILNQEIAYSKLISLLN